MKLEEGPLFGALIIGAGVAYLVYNKTQNYLYAVLAGIGLAVADYIFLMWVKKLTKK